MKTDAIAHKAQNEEEIGRLLREARESKGFELGDVSDKIKLPESLIVDIENGQIVRHLKEIYGLLYIYAASIHEIFNNFFNSDFSESYNESTDIRDCVGYVLDCIKFHKKLHGKSASLSHTPLARGRSSSGRTNLSGASLVQKKKALRKAVPSVIESRAREVIEKHSLYKLPINVYQVAANLDIPVSFETFPTDLYMKLKGFCYKEDSFSIIGINRSHPVALQRFTMAHELHHLLYDLNSARFLCGLDNVEEAFEQNAENFAAELLMPRELVKKLVSHPLNVHYLTIHLVAAHFGVSYEAAAIRLSKFGLTQSSEVYGKAYREKDKKKTRFLLENKLKYLTAVFGLETGIPQLQFNSDVKRHDLCGSPITDIHHKVCWHCGLELKEPTLKEFCLKSPYRQHPSNLSPEKVLSVERRKKDRENEDYKQLSFNLDTRLR